MSTRHRKQRAPDSPAPAVRTNAPDVTQQQHAPVPPPASAPAPSQAIPIVGVDTATLAQWLQASMHSQQQQAATHQMCTSVLQTLIAERQASAGPVVGTLRDFNSFSPPMFSGKEAPEEADAWLKLMQRLLRASHIPKEDMVSLVQTKMEGEAGEWIESEMALRDQEMSWDTFQEIFKGQFFPPSSERLMIGKFVRLIQGDKNVRAYSREFQKLSRYAKELLPTEAARVERYIEGLKTGLRALVRACSPNTFLEAYQHALQMEQDIEGEENNQIHSQELNISPNIQDTLPVSGEPIRTASRACFIVPSTSVTQKIRSSVTCHGCGRKGHSVQECRLVTGKCMICGSLEHRVRECPENRSKDIQALSLARSEGIGRRTRVVSYHSQTLASGGNLQTQNSGSECHKKTRGKGKRKRHAVSAGSEPVEDLNTGIYHH